MGCVLSIGQVAAALVLVVGLGVVGYLFVNNTNDVAMLNNRSGGGCERRIPLTNSAYSNPLRIP